MKLLPRTDRRVGCTLRGERTLFAGVLCSQRLVEEGARYIVVSGTLPAGCLPMALTKYGYGAANATEYDRRTGCLRRLNGLAEYHNWMLREAVGHMRRKYPATKLVYADFYRPVARLLRRPAKFGESLVTLRLLLWNM